MKLSTIKNQIVIKSSLFNTKLRFMVRRYTCATNINLDILENNVTAIIGPSGCGKSTYIKTLNRMVELVPSVKLLVKFYTVTKIFSMKTILKKN